MTVVVTKREEGLVTKEKVGRPGSWENGKLDVDPSIHLCIHPSILSFIHLFISPYVHPPGKSGQVHYSQTGSVPLSPLLLPYSPVQVQIMRVGRVRQN